MADGAQGQQGQGQQGQGQGQGTGGAAPPPWFEGKTSAENVGYWDNKGWGRDDPAKIAFAATERARQLESHYGVPAEQLLKLPKPDADAEAWKPIRERLGMPKEAKDYDLAGAKFDDAFTDTLRNAMHKAGMPKDAAAEFAKTLHAHQATEAQKAQTVRAAADQAEMQQLQKDWGPDFQFNRLTAEQGLRRALGSDEAAAKTVDAMKQAIGYKATMEFWRRIGQGTTEATFIPSPQGANGQPTTLEGAKARLAELQSDKAWAKRLTSGDATAAREFASYMKLIHGEA
jgi:hypothetical protein